MLSSFIFGFITFNWILSLISSLHNFFNVGGANISLSISGILIFISISGILALALIFGLIFPSIFPFIFGLLIFIFGFFTFILGILPDKLISGPFIFILPEGNFIWLSIIPDKL